MPLDPEPLVGFFVERLLGGTNGGLIGAVGTGKSIKEERVLAGPLFFVGAAGATVFEGVGFATGAATSFAGVLFFTGVDSFTGNVFMAGAAFFTGAAFFGGVAFSLVLATVFFTAGADFVDLTAGAAFPLEEAGFEVFFFAAMEQG